MLEQLQHSTLVIDFAHVDEEEEASTMPKIEIHPNH